MRSILSQLCYRNVLTQIILGEADDENPMEFVNYNAFLAHLMEAKTVFSEPTVAIWALRNAFEEDTDSAGRHDMTVLAAAQWILWYGQSLFESILWHNESVEADNVKEWKFGQWYKGKGLLDRSRWDFWKTGFQQAADNDGYSAECRDVASRAAKLMQVIGKTLSF